MNEDYYLVEDCCNLDRRVFIKVGGPILDDGLYEFPGADPVNGFDLNSSNGNAAPDYLVFPGFCYKFTHLGQTGSTYDSIPGAFVSQVLDGAGIHATDCNKGLTCTDCDTGQYYIKADPCCGGTPIFLRGEPFIGGSQGGSMPSFSITNYDGVYLVTVPQDPGQSDGLVRGECYTFSHGVVGDGLAGAPADLAAYNLLDYPPSISQIQFMHQDDCTHVNPDVPCPECNPICYLLTNCDGTTIQSTAVDFAAVVGTYIELDTFTGSWFVQINEGVCTDPVNNLKITNLEAEPCPCECYEVISAPGSVGYIDCNGDPQITYAPDKFCAQAPPLVKEIPLQPPAVVINQGPCEGGECPDRCFQLINCDPEKYPDQNAVITSTLQSLYQYINPSSVVELAGYEGCWTVQEADCLCIVVTVNGISYQANYSGSTYNNNKVFVVEILGVTYYIWANTFPGSWVISQTVGDTTMDVLAQISGGILNCPIADESVWINGLLPDGNPVTSVITEDCPDNEACDCPVDVTVLQEYRTCEECIGPIAYKLTNCETGEVTYSIQDLSAYVDKIIKDDCNCWTVEQIDYQPPSNVTISNVIEFTDCASCLATFYQLDPCDRLTSPIITPTNLSAYLNQVVQLDGCPGCYTVNLYLGTGQPPQQQPVEVTAAFGTCLECETVTPRCSTVFNTTTEDQVYQYIDVNGNTQSTDIVCSGHSSLRYCVQKWVETGKGAIGIFNYYGDCSVFDVLGSANGCDCVGIEIAGADGASFSGTASWTGQIYDGMNVFSFIIEVDTSEYTYYIWYASSVETWYITQTIGNVTPAQMIGSFESTNECPIFTDAEWVNANWPDPAQDVISLQTTEGVRCVQIKSKIGECPQYFPNNRKVKPGYNTPICSSEKYDKITCNFAEIAYKEALALRYGISNCCPELDEKWLISKELIELQALKDPKFDCPPITDCCGNTGSDCSCNS